MTLPPEKLGDQGQRYVVQTTGYPDPEAKGWQNIGYTDDREGAIAMMRGIALAPSVGHVQIVDREAKTVQPHPLNPIDVVALARRQQKFDRMAAQTDKGWEKATIYGIEIGSMTPEEQKIAFGWAMTELRKLRGQ